MIRALLLLLASVGPAAATQEAWPALYDVAGVAADDALNVRAAPGAHAPILGQLPHDARDVEIVATDERGAWGLVNFGEGTGWVSFAYLARQPGQWQGAIPEIRRCFGNEPFWSLAIDSDGRITFAEPDAAPREGELRMRWPSQNRRDRHGLAAGLGGSTDLFAVIGAAACSDGSSDRAYGLAVDLVLDDRPGGRMLSGCCSLSR